MFVSHQMGMIAHLCKRSVLLNGGEIVMTGDTQTVINQYLQTTAKAGNVYTAGPEKIKDKEAGFVYQKVTGKEGNALSQVTSQDEIILEMGIQINKWHPEMELSLSLQNKVKGRIFTVNTPLRQLMSSAEKQKVIRFTVPPGLITPNHYSWLSSIHIPGMQLVDVLRDECAFTIHDAGTDFARYEGTDYGVFILTNYKLETIGL